VLISREGLPLQFDEDKESTMIESPNEASAGADEFPSDDLRAMVNEMRRHPPQFDHVAPPIDVDDVMAHCTGGLYEGFEEDVKRMRRGLSPLGPRE
jgi:hypothetical protein